MPTRGRRLYSRRVADPSGTVRASASPGPAAIRERVLLAPFTTLGIGGPARWFLRAESATQVEEALAWAAAQRLPLFVLGGGSNLLVADAGFPGLVLQVGIKGVKDQGDGVFEVGAGEVWDEFVDRMVRAGMQGVECLAGIP